VTLAGIPASVAVVPGTGAVVDSASPPYHTPGLFAVPVEVQALDADGNIIIGPGAPTVQSVRVASGGAYAKVAPANGTDPFAYVLTPAGGVSGGKSVTLSATVRALPLGDGTVSPPITASTTYAFTPALAVGSGPFVTVYSIESMAVVKQFFACPGACGGNSVDDLAADADGNLAADVAQFTGSLTTSVFEIPSATTVANVVLRSAEGVHSVGGVAFGKNGTLYSANGNTGTIFGGMHLPPAITSYAFGATAPSYTVTNTFAQPGGIAVDERGNVYESDPNDTLTVVRYPPHSQRIAATYADPSLAAPTRMALDAAGGLYVIDQQNEDIAYFAPGHTALTSTLTDASFAAGIDALLFDPSGNLWVSVGGNNEIERLEASALPNAVVITATLPQSGFMGWIP
jgi:sugar lactone lactonase YvrE